MDQSKILDFKKLLSESSNILILLPQFVNTDTIATATSLYDFISQSMRKNVLIASSNKIPARFSSFLKTYNIEEKFIISEIKPLKYIITINETEKDIELAVNRKDNTVEIVMQPKKSEIDLSKLTVKSVGIKFDLFITINTQNLEDLGNLYDKSDNIFESTSTVSIGLDNQITYTKNILSNKELSTSSEMILEIIKSFGAKIDDKSLEILLKGILAGTDGLHKLNSTATLQYIKDLITDTSIKDRFNDVFYKNNQNKLELYRLIFANLVQKGNTIYSELSKEKMALANVSAEDIKNLDYLPFNIIGTNDLFIICYPDNDKTEFILESTDLDNTFKKLKENNLNPSKSTNLINLTSKMSVEEVLEILGIENVETPSNLFNSEDKINEDKVNTVEETLSIESDDLQKKSEQIVGADSSQKYTLNNEEDSKEVTTPFKHANNKKGVVETSGPFEKAN